MLYLGRVRRKLQVISTSHHTWQIFICWFQCPSSISCCITCSWRMLHPNMQESTYLIPGGARRLNKTLCIFELLNRDVTVKIKNHCATFLTIVNFGLSTARPPGGSLGAPVTNWQKARCRSGVNSPMISSNWRHQKQNTILSVTKNESLFLWTKY